jgi:hypothetical protein
MTDIDGEQYWDGGLFSNTPLGPAIKALEQAADGDRTVERELIVVELFPTWIFHGYGRGGLRLTGPRF